MKKLLVAMIAMAFVIGLVADMAVADDRLSLSGQVRVRAWSTENYDDFDDSDDSDENEYWDQRFRVQAVISPADGVKGVLRFDFAEEVWGGNNWTGSRYGAGVKNDFSDVSSSEGGDIQVDRAYIDVTKGIVNIKGGLAYWGLGNNYAYDNNNPGLGITINTPVKVTLGYTKEDEDPSGTIGTETNLADDTDASKDIDQYFINVGYKTDVFSIDAFYAAQKDDSPAENEPTLLGALARFGAGPLNVAAEIDVFGGDDAAGTDFTGIQFFGDVGMAISDALKLGVNLIYSDGSDPDERKIVRMPNAFFGSMYYSDYGPFATDIAPLDSGDVMDPGAGTAGRLGGSGALGGGVYASFFPIDTLGLYGQVLYLTADEDYDSQYEDGIVFNIGAEYQLLQNTTIAAAYNLTDASINGAGASDDAASALVARLQITF